MRSINLLVGFFLLFTGLAHAGSVSLHLSTDHPAAGDPIRVTASTGSPGDKALVLVSALPDMSAPMILGVGTTNSSGDFVVDTTAPASFEGASFHLQAWAITHSGLETSEVQSLTIQGTPAIDVQLQAARTSGVAPLAVHFDAVGTTSPGIEKPFHELHYVWNFGDEGSGTWEQSGKSKNIQKGPVAGHVFDHAGSYLVTLTATDPMTGASASKQITITVQDPEEVYADKTVCISTGSILTSEVPQGALLRPNIAPGSLRGEIISQIQNGKRRILLKRGDSFSMTGMVTLNIPGPGTIGAFGTGDKPFISSSGSEAFRIGTATRNPTTSSPSIDWRIMDLSLAGVDSSSDDGISSEGTSEQFLLYRVDLNNFDFTIGLGPSIVSYYNVPLFDQMAFVECNLTNAGRYNAYFGASRAMFLGNYLHVSGEHLLRSGLMQNAVISHNRFDRQGDSDNALIKLHARKTNGSSCGVPCEDGHDSYDVVISQNRFLSLDPHAVALGPQNTTSNEWVHDVIFENNIVSAVAGPNWTATLLNVWGSDCTVRNNIFDLTNSRTNNAKAVSISKRGPYPNDVTGNVVYNNTFYRGDSGNGVVMVKVSNDARPGSKVFNNVMYAPSSSNVSFVQNAQASSNNRNTGNVNPFVHAPSFPPVAGDFALNPLSSLANVLIDAGIPVPVFEDYFERARPQGAGFDLGAIETQ